MARKSQRSRSRRSYTGRARHFARTHTTHLLATGGALVAAYGVLGPPQPAWAWNLEDMIGSNFISKNPVTSASDGIHNMEQAIPIYGTDPNMASARSTVGMGVVMLFAAKLLPKFMPSLRRLSFKMGRGRKVAIFG